MKKILAAAAFFAALSLAFAQTDSVTIAATKPAASITMSFVNSSGTDVTALSFGSGALSAGTTYNASSDVILKHVYTNVGTDADNLSVAFSTTLPTGYTLTYVVTPYSGGVAGTPAAAVAYTTAYTGTIQSAAHGAGTAYMTQSGATSVATTLGDASRLTFKLVADTSVSTNLSATLTATLTAN